MCIIILSVFNYIFYDLKLVGALCRICYPFAPLENSEDRSNHIEKLCKDLSFDKSGRNLKVKQTR